MRRYCILVASILCLYSVPLVSHARMRGYIYRDVILVPSLVYLHLFVGLWSRNKKVATCLAQLRTQEEGLGDWGIGNRTKICLEQEQLKDETGQNQKDRKEKRALVHFF